MYLRDGARSFVVTGTSYSASPVPLHERSEIGTWMLKDEGRRAMDMQDAVQEAGSRRVNAVSPMHVGENKLLPNLLQEVQSASAKINEPSMMSECIPLPPINSRYDSSFQ